MVPVVIRPLFLVCFLIGLQGCSSENAPAVSASGSIESPKDVLGKETFVNTVIVQVDGETFSFQTTRYDMDQPAAPAGLESTQFELSDGKTQKLTLVFHAPIGRPGLAGQYQIVAPGSPAKADTVEFHFTQALDEKLGRRMYPGGGGAVTVLQNEGVYQIDMQVSGDGAFRSKDADPMRVQLSFKPQPINR